MPTLRVRSLLLALVVCGAATLGGASAASAKCRAGVHKFGSTQARTFCGPAKATVTFAGAKHTIASGGQCSHSGGYFTVNVGTVVLGKTSRKHPNYFGITVGKGAKAVAFVYGGTTYSVGQAKVKLAAHDKKGSFSGTLIGGKGGPVSGSFTCG